MPPIDEGKRIRQELVEFVHTPFHDKSEAFELASLVGTCYGRVGSFSNCASKTCGGESKGNLLPTVSCLLEQLKCEFDF